jgi:hypothetical protein
MENVSTSVTEQNLSPLTMMIPSVRLTNSDLTLESFADRGKSPHILQYSTGDDQEGCFQEVES